VENRALTYEVTMEFLIFSIIQEVLIGFVIAIASNYLFAGVQMAGHIIGLDMGFAMATFFDSSSNANLPVLSMMMYYMTFLIYILINGHHYLLGAIFYSYEVIPFDAWQMTGKTAQNMISLVGDVFMISLQVAAPVFITLFVTSISLAFISKIVPQLNIFVVAFQLKILIGLMMLLTVFPIIISIFRNIFMNFERNVIRLIETMIVG
jgi:flagellar biosynthetic protein FliR